MNDNFYKKLADMLIDNMVETRGAIETAKYLAESGVTADQLVNELLFSEEIVDHIFADIMNQETK